jgi:hypothetical protein
MVTIASLILPLLVSAVFVWIASAIIWMFMPHHKKDFKAFPDEDALRNALLPQNLAPGQYNIPHFDSQEEYKKPESQKKYKKGPVGFMTILPNGLPNMGKNMVLSFLFYLIVGLFVAYIASRTLVADSYYLAVFRVTGTVAFVAYGLGIIQEATWFGRPWSSVAKQLFDSLIYALLTAGTFGWLWPN